MVRIFSKLILTTGLLIALLPAVLWGKDVPTVRIAAFNYYPAIFLDTDNQVRGFYVDMLSEIAEREQIRFEYVFGSWNEGLERLRTGGVDLITSVAYTEERATYMDFGQQALLTVWGELYIPQDVPTIPIRELQDQPIAVMRGDHNARSLKEHLDKFGISSQFIEYRDFDEVFTAIKEKKVIGGVVNSVFGDAAAKQYEVHSSGIAFNPFDIYFATAKGQHAELLNLLDDYLYAWRNDSTSVYYQSRLAWGAVQDPQAFIPDWVIRLAAVTALVFFSGLVFIVLLRHRVNRATHELQKSNSMIRLLLDSTAEGIYGLDPQGVCTFCNATSVRILGFDNAEQILGHKMHDLIHHSHADGTSMPATECKLLKGMNQQTHSDSEVFWRTDGSCFPVEYWSYPIHQDGKNVGLVVSFVDITKRKCDEILLRKLSLAMEQSPASVVITNLDGDIEYVNPKFTEMTGYSYDEVLGQNPRILQSGDKTQEDYQQLWSHLLAGEQWQGEFLNKHKSGRLFWERALISPLRDEQGQITHYVGIKEDITTQKTYEKELEYQATHDILTGLANRALLKDRLAQAIHYAQRSKRIVAIVQLNLDRFKVINDTLGHATGDVLLCQIADRLQNVVRETDTVARFGGDEFMILLTEIAVVQDLEPVIQKILQVFKDPYQVEQRQLKLSASLGVSSYPQHSHDPETLIRFADIAMYESKKSGMAYSLYEVKIDPFDVGILDLEHDLHGALERHEFCLYYQPKVNLVTGTISGCEALLRWQHPELGMVSPGQFIPLAEETGLIVPIGTWVIEEACRQSLSWQKEGHPPVRIAVNLSARQFRQGDLVTTVSSILSQTGLDPSLLELELTESMIMDDPQGAEVALIELKNLGVSLSLDDFGTGYSSLNYLSRFPVDHLKIDMGFIRAIGTSDARTAVVSSIIHIAHNLQLTAIAEGVETQEQLAFLIANECDAMQGYLFSKPLPAAEFDDLLRRGTNLENILDGMSSYN